MAAEVVIEQTYGPAKKWVAAGLESFNRQHMRASGPKPFAVTAKEDGAIRGGLMADSVGAWTYVSILWVEDDYRRRGVGTALLKEAEREARARGAVGILVDTFSFQAPGFYEKNGYRAYGAIEGCPETGMTWHRFEKRF